MGRDNHVNERSGDKSSFGNGKAIGFVNVLSVTADVVKPALYHQNTTVAIVVHCHLTTTVGPPTLPGHDHDNS